MKRISSGAVWMWHAHLARESRAGRPCHLAKLRHYRRIIRLRLLPAVAAVLALAVTTQPATGSFSVLSSPVGRRAGDEGPKLTDAISPHPALSQRERIKAVYDVRTFGAKGDSKTLDTPAINKAIDAAAAAGGGTVIFPAGDYLSVSIHLKSNVALYLDQGATIVGASQKDGHNYDDPEPNEWGDKKYQDFGHSHWQN